MEKLFFDLTYISIEMMLLKVLAFVFCSGFILYLLYLFLSKILFRKNTHRKEINLRLTFLWAIFSYFILFNIYIFICFYKIGVDSFHWSTLNFYFGIMPQCVIYFGLIIFFLIKRQALKNIINEKSIN